MNINFPANLITFGHYLSVAQGEMDEITRYIPDLAEYVLDAQQLDYLPIEMPACFERMEVDSVFFLRGYGKSFTLVLGATFIVLPGIYMLSRICSEIRFF